MDARRIGLSLLTGLVGGIGVLYLVIAMNRIDRRPKAPPGKKEIVFDVPEKRKKPPTRKPRPKPRPKPTRAPPPPIPQISQAVGGVDVGLWAGSIDMGDGADSLLGDASDTVMTAETVDSLPDCSYPTKPQYPARARDRGQEGYVTVSYDFDARGSVANVKVVDSSPPGVFDKAALQAARDARCSPATFQGRAVPVNGVELKINFDLERE